MMSLKITTWKSQLTVKVNMAELLQKICVMRNWAFALYDNVYIQIKRKQTRFV